MTSIEDRWRQQLYLPQLAWPLTHWRHDCNKLFDNEHGTQIQGNNWNLKGDETAAWHGTLECNLCISMLSTSQTGTPQNEISIRPSGLTPIRPPSDVTHMVGSVPRQDGEAAWNYHVQPQTVRWILLRKLTWLERWSNSKLRFTTRKYHFCDAVGFHLRVLKSWGDNEVWHIPNPRADRPSILPHGWSSFLSRKFGAWPWDHLAQIRFVCVKLAAHKHQD